MPRPRKYATEEERKAAKRERDRRYARENRHKERARQQAWVAKDPDYHKKRRLKTKYGMTLEQKQELLRAQGGGCVICGGPADCVDHDHATGAVRGVLCRNHNLGLGYFKDNSDHLRSAIYYLSNHADLRP